MSLNGLDAEKVTAAYDAALTEAAGWFLLHYISRDEVDLLASGDNGFLEAREAIAKYEESSPLFGLVVYKKKKALLKFVPEDTSRLLQARLSVHVQSVIEKFPHDALVSLTTADELTESALSSALTQLKSSGSIRSNASKKQRPLTEIPEDTDEVVLNSSPPRKEEERDTTELYIGPESPPDPLLSPASEPFSPARLEPSSIPFTTPEVEKGVFVAISPQLSVPDITTDHELSESNSSPEVHSRPSDSLARSTTYELEDSLAYKPKVKLGPRPSLDFEKRRPSRGSSYRPVAALPVGLRVSTRSNQETDRPGTAKSVSKSPTDEMPRIAAFSAAVEPPTSRPGSIASVPSHTSGPDAESPLATTTPTITPEKLRLMKALEKRKKYQQSKQALAEQERLSSKDSESTTTNGAVEEADMTNGSQAPAEPMAAETSQLADVVTASQSSSLPQPTAVEPAHPISSEAPVALQSIQHEPKPRSSGSTSNISLVDADADTAKEAVKSDDLDPVGNTNILKETSVVDSPPVASAYIGHSPVTNRESIQEGVYLARSESSSSLGEAEDDTRENGARDNANTVGRISSVQLQNQATKDALGSSAKPASKVEDEHAALPQEDGGDSGIAQSIRANATETNMPGSVELASDDRAQSLAANERESSDANVTFLHLDSEQPTPAAGLEQATGYLESKTPTTAESPKVAHPQAVSAAKETLHSPNDSVSTLKTLETSHRHTDSTSTVKPPPLPEGPTRTIISNVQITTDDGTRSRGKVDALNVETKPSPAAALADPKRLSAATTDTKRSSADSKASKRRPPPLATSKHDSSDLASIDGDLLYEELQSAKLEEATSMVVARSPATPMFKDRPSSTLHDTFTQSPVSPVGIPGASDPMRPKLVHTSSPPVLSRFSSDQSTHTLRPASTSANETLDIAKGRTFALSNNTATQPSPTASNGNSSPGRKGSGVSSLISQRIKAIESARANGSASPTDRTAIIAPQIVSQRKASLTTPPGSAGTGSPGSSRPYQNSSPSSNDFVARTFGSVRVSSGHGNRGTNGTLERQSSRDSALGLTHSNSSSRLNSYNSSPSERSTQKPKTSYFSVEPTEKPKKSPSFSSPVSTPSSAGGSGGGGGGRLSISSKKSTKSNSSQKSNTTERQRSPGRSESSMSSDGGGGDGDKKRDSRGSRIFRRISGLASSPRRNIAEALTDQPIAETMNSGNHASEPLRGGAGGGGGTAVTKKRASTGKKAAASQTSGASGTKWIARDLGDVNVQFPDNLLWKRRHMGVDASGTLVLAPASTDKASKLPPKRFHISQFTTPYVPDQDREELPHSIILDLQDSSTLQCSCENAREQAMVLQVLRSAHATFPKK